MPTNLNRKRALTCQAGCESFSLSSFLLVRFFFHLYQHTIITINLSLDDVKLEKTVSVSI